MYVFNSISLNQDDSEMTMINPSLLYDANDKPIISCLPILRRAQQANQTQTSRNSDDKQDYLYINRNSSENIKEIENALKYYRLDLKQDSNSQFDCNRELIRRLIDFLRPIYSSNEQETKDLNDLYEDITILHEKRFLEQKEKNDQLQDKIRHLKKSIITTPIEDNDRKSLMTNLYRINTMCDYEEWIEMEEETKQLYHLVKTQREQIDKLVELLEINNDEKYSVPLYVPNRCSVCDYEFPIRSTEMEITNHIENCLAKSNVVQPNPPTEFRQVLCPYCNEILTNNDELANYQHLSQCYNEMTGNF